MQVTTLLIDQYERDGWTHRQAAVAVPVWKDIESAIRDLNQFTRPAVHLLLDATRDDDECMVVMGGEGAYWVAVQCSAAHGTHEREEG